MLGQEAGLSGQVIEVCPQHVLQLWAGRDVDDPAAGGAEQVVVVLGQFLDQLETGIVVTGGDVSDDCCGLEIGEVAIGGAARQAG
jgi:hypothetical protein